MALLGGSGLFSESNGFEGTMTVLLRSIPDAMGAKLALGSADEFLLETLRTLRMLPIQSDGFGFELGDFFDGDSGGVVCSGTSERRCSASACRCEIVVFAVENESADWCFSTGPMALSTPFGQVSLL